MLAFNKRIIYLFASLGALAFFPNNNVSLKKTAARIQWKQQNVEKNNYNQEVQGPRLIVKKATQPKVDNFSKSFCFFTAPGFGNGVYVAEIPETQENNFELYWDTTISDPNFANIYLEIYNPRIGALLYRTKILFTNCTFEFESGAFYLIEFSATTNLYTNVHLSCKEVL